MSGFRKFELTPLKAPCRGCNKRYMNCHSECEDYIKFDKANEVIRQKKLKKIHEADAFYFNKLNRIASMKQSGAKFRRGHRAK